MSAFMDEAALSEALAGRRVLVRLQGWMAPAESTLPRRDSTKAFVELGWKPRFTVEEAILKTVTWYREFHRRPGAVRAFTESQIAEYAEGWSASSRVRSASTPAIRVAACV